VLIRLNVLQIVLEIFSADATEIMFWLRDLNRAYFRFNEQLIHIFLVLHIFKGTIVKILLVNSLGLEWSKPQWKSLNISKLGDLELCRTFICLENVKFKLVILYAFDRKESVSAD